jgi:hypothetical protein
MVVNRYNDTNHSDGRIDLLDVQIKCSINPLKLASFSNPNPHHMRQHACPKEPEGWVQFVGWVDVQTMSTKMTNHVLNQKQTATLFTFNAACYMHEKRSLLSEPFHNLLALFNPSVFCMKVIHISLFIVGNFLQPIFVLYVITLLAAARFACQKHIHARRH